MRCFDCFHSVTCGGPCQMDMEQLMSTDSTCECFLDKDLVVKLPCPIGSTIYIHIYNRETELYEVGKFSDIELSEIGVLVQDNEPIFLDEATATEALTKRNCSLCRNRTTKR